ncbi:OmpP1/FadL family transporter [Undibacter mobilis]|uniref:Transporter n=1 Tax=Undibacter mobilis TaxID=2292256 RepID=A0A371BC51_9BRAD|nr:outer membrane protein transport protein [Undibacter mobilis]RDV05142.1 transporter [Undibacter mobilis]
MINKGGMKSLLLGCASIGVLLAATASANAGAFALREQSAYGQGASFAGIAAGGALSSMFWNAATMTQWSGKTMELGVSGIMPNASHSYTASSLAPFPTPGDSGLDALVPNSYGSMQLNKNVWIGMAVNAPVGLGVHFPQVNAASSGSGNSAQVKTYNVNPSIAYKFNDMISVAVGFQAQYIQASYDAFLGTQPRIGTLNGADWGFGWTAGITITPMPRTTIGIGYRSAIDHTLSGTWDVPAAVAPGTQPGSVNLGLKLPGTLTVGLRHGLTDRLTLLAGFEWANWSRIGTSRLLQPNGSAVTLVVGGTPTPVTFPFEYKDGYFYSLGGEYMINPAWTVRAGIGFEKSPITDAVRTTRIPDNDRMWYSVGASYKPASIKGLTFDIGYSFIDVKDASVCMGPAAAGGCPSNPWSGTTAYNGTVKSYINIVSVALRYQWDAEPARVKQAYLK